MADYFTKASFRIRVTHEEASLLREAFDLTPEELLGDSAAEAYERRSNGFKAAFKRGTDEPFLIFCDLFTDPENPLHGCTVEEFDRTDLYSSLHIYGDQVDPEATANLLQFLARSALPFGFTFTHDCSRMRPGTMTGGFVVITQNDLTFRENDHELKSAIAQINDKDERPLVIAKRDAEHGLVFWNKDIGFGPLTDAIVYSQKEARAVDLPISDDQPEWILMPRWPQ